MLSEPTLLIVPETPETSLYSDSAASTAPERAGDGSLSLAAGRVAGSARTAAAANRAATPADIAQQDRTLRESAEWRFGSIRVASGTSEVARR